MHINTCRLCVNTFGELFLQTGSELQARSTPVRATLTEMNRVIEGSETDLFIRYQAGFFVLAEDGVCAFVRGRTREQLLLAVNQVAGVVRGQLEAVTVGDRVGGAGFHAVAAEDAAVVIDVVNLGVTLGAADTLLGSVLGGLNVDAIRGTGRGTEEAGHALLQPVLIALQHVHAAEAVLEHRAAHQAGAIGIVFDDRGLEHLDERDAHALGDGGDVFNDSHDLVEYTNWTGVQ